MFDDISELVNETFHQSNQFEKIDFLKDKSGLIYRVDRSGQTFVVRILLSEDLAFNLKDLSDNPESYPSLRLINADAELFNQVHYFECSLESAKKLKKLFGGQRFPVKEEDVLNVSDPGYSLWLKEEEGIEIFFKLSQISDMKKMIKLGPIAEIQDLLPELDQNREDLHKFFEIQELALSPSSFKIRAMKTPAFKDFVKFLKIGIITSEFNELIKESQMGKIFKTLADARRFWIEVGKDLTDDIEFN